MATRANVLLFDENGICQKQYYVHWDGYPASLGCRLIDIVNKAYSVRLKYTGTERKVYSFCDRVIQFANRYLRDRKLRNDVDGFLEEEEIDYLHGDIEYLYTIRFVKDNDHQSRTMCSVNVIPMPCSGRDSDVQKKLHNTPTNELNDGWLFLIGTRMALFAEV
jgi:hypothetical protein